MFDTHCHLNFKRFSGQVNDVVGRAKEFGVNYMLVPGTDYVSSQKSVEIAEKYEGVYAAVGIHPHHIFEIYNQSLKFLSQDQLASRLKSGPVVPRSFSEFEESRRHSLAQTTDLRKNFDSLLPNKKVVAIGEVGIDRHIYRETKYADYKVGESFVELQKEYLKSQIVLAIEYDKSLILHNREAKTDILSVLAEKWDKKLAGHTVFHCCEPDGELLDFALRHNIYIGVDGDVTYNREKQVFIKKVPPTMLVLETDSPFLLPEPLRSQKLYPNEPKNLPLIAEFVGRLINQSVNSVIDITTINAKKLLRL